MKSPLTQAQVIELADRLGWAADLSESQKTTVLDNIQDWNLAQDDSQGTETA